jgi:hypothetical protein
MGAHSAFVSSEAVDFRLSKVAAFPGMRALLWDGDLLFASRGYKIFKARLCSLVRPAEWEPMGYCKPSWWRNLSSTFRVSSRLFRDGFHALAVLSSGHVVGAIPGAIVTLSPGDREFRLTHKVQRGTRPLHIAVTPDHQIFWGEYFDNPRRDEVRIYVSTDYGDHWDVAYTFARGAIRHVHNIVYDRWEGCLWVLTGDDREECRILNASYDFRHIEVMLSGSQQTRAAALIPTRNGVYFSSDTPAEQNYIYCLERHGRLSRLAPLNSSSIYGCRVRDHIFFSTMVEPTDINFERNVCLYGNLDGVNFRRLLEWKKDRWPMRLFQYGNAFLPDGPNETDLLAVTTIAVEGADCETSLWRMHSL